MSEDEMKGKAKNLKGRIKQGVGAVTGNKKLEREGMAERIGGAAEEKIDEVRRKAGEAMEDLGEDIKKE